MKEALELREAAKAYKDLWLPDDHYDAFIAGAMWQAKRMYTEEDMRKAIDMARELENWWDLEWQHENDKIIKSLKQK